MTKRLSVKVEEYQKDGQTKGKYIDIGVLMENQNGPYLLLDPSINLAGVLTKQNILASQNNQQIRSSVMVSVFDNSQQQPQQQNNQGYQNQQSQNYNSGFNQQPNPQQQNNNDLPPF